MALLPIYTVPHPILRKKAQRVDKINKNIKRIISNLVETLRHEKGIGLAANQVGIPLQIAVIESKAEKSKNGEGVLSIPLTIIINPEITKFSSQTETAEEGCLSIPNIWGMVKRPSKVIVKGLNEKGEEIEIKASGLFARVLQHEIDHLSGILFTDKADLDTLHKITPDGQKIKINLLSL